MLNRVITISREFGSGGRTIGKRVAKKLGIPYFFCKLLSLTPFSYDLMLTLN